MCILRFDSLVASDDEEEDDDGIGRRLKDENVSLFCSCNSRIVCHFHIRLYQYTFLLIY